MAEILSAATALLGSERGLRTVAAVALAGCALLSGCASTSEATPGDPLEPLNRSVYGFNKAVDKAVLRPVAVAYDTVVPAPASAAVTNFFGNLDDVRIAANNLLQFKVTDAFEDVGRVAFNSTLGLGGFIDIASSVGMPKHDEDFGQTLGVWGVPAGPYVVLPFLGPSSVRHTPGRAVDAVTNPRILIDSTTTALALTATNTIDRRAGLLQADEVLRQAGGGIDEYSFVRDAYVQRRESKVYDGDPPVELIEE